MLTRFLVPQSPEEKRSAPFLRRWCRDTNGTTAIEFAMVSLPFFFFVFGVIGLGAYFFTTTALESAVDSASRQIRTGQAQKGGITQQQFRQLICNAAGGTAAIINCDDSRLKVHVQSAPAWAGVTPTPCLTNGALTSSAGQSTDALSQSSGGASQAVVVTVCYEFSLAQSMPFLKLGNMGNGSSVIQAATTFRTEPYQ